MKKIKPEDKFMLCINNKGHFCKIKKHKITNGFASKAHCDNCKNFKLRR